MRSTFYYKGLHREVASKLRDHINSAPSFLSSATAGSPRAVGDALESIVADKLESCLGDWCRDYSSDFARRSMADIAFTDKEGMYSIVDVKTHRKDTQFNMPNLTSVRRLARFYESDLNVFSIIMICYKVLGTRVAVSDVLFAPIEFLDWRCLNVGALGWGQIQITNSNDIRLVEGQSRKRWMLQLCDVMLGFYPKEITKIEERIDRFRSVREHWRSKEDIWS